MAKVRVTDTEIIFRCPASCCREHRLPRDRWTLLSPVDSPTIAPSIKETVNPKEHADYQPQHPTTVCHCVIEQGKIRFCDDCTHELAGQTLPMEDIN